MADLDFDALVEQLRERRWRAYVSPPSVFVGVPGSFGIGVSVDRSGTCMVHRGRWQPPWSTFTPTPEGMDLLTYLETMLHALGAERSEAK